MGTFRLKHTFTAGVLSPLMSDRVDFERFKNGSSVLENMICTTQGPVYRRSGFEFLLSMEAVGMHLFDTRLRMIPFIYDETTSYVLIFYMHYSGVPSMCVGYTLADGTWSGLVLKSASPGTPPADDLGITYIPPFPIYYPNENTDIFKLGLPADFDIEGFDWAQSADEMWIAQTGVRPMMIQRDAPNIWWAVDIYNQFTDPPTLSWSDVYGWPERVTFHQQRVAYAANVLKRNTVWLSVAGDFVNFGDFDATVEGPADAVTYTLDSGTQNRIQWMLSAKSLNIGTLGSEWTTIGSGMSAPSITPDGIFSQRHTNSGSENNKPLLIGLTTLFLERHGRTVNEFVYDYAYDGYKVADLSVLAPHLTEHSSIIDWSYQQTPGNVIWCVLEDGDLLGLTYQRQHKVVGWHKHTTDGKFKVCTCIPGRSREDDLWVIIKRSGKRQYHIEKLADTFIESEVKYGRFLDSFKTYDNSVNQNDYIDGVHHLAGKTVDVFVDGMVHAPVLVTSSGYVQLDAATYNSVTIGLPYTSEVRPLLSDIPTQEGTSLGRTQKITALDIDLYNSAGMYIGRIHPDEYEAMANAEKYKYEEEVSFRTPADLMGEPIPLFTGIYHWTYPEGYGRSAGYYIRQKQPLPLTVRGITDQIEVYE